MYALFMAELSQKAPMVEFNQRAQTAIWEIKDIFNKYIIQNGPGFLANLAMAAAIFYAGRWGARLAERALDGVLTRAKIDETLSKFLCRIVYAIILVNVVLIGLRKVGIDTGTVTAIFAAAGLAVGLALQGSLSNFAAGILMIILRPLKVGDFVEAAGTKGIVEEINVFNTIMRTSDNIEITVPNSAITGGNITNYSSKPTRRIDLVVGCGYNDELLAVKRFLEQLVASDPRILREPAPLVAVSELADHSVNFVVRPWVVNANYWAVRWDLTEKIKLGFDQLGFTIPYPQRDLHIHAAPAPQMLAAPAAAPNVMNAASLENVAIAAPQYVVQPPAVRPELTSDTDGRLRPRRAA